MSPTALLDGRPVALHRLYAGFRLSSTEWVVRPTLQLKRIMLRPIPSPDALRLLARPEPVEAVAEVPDGPPVRFRWRRALYRVARAEGPERIASEWWRNDDLTRDYFRVEDISGYRFWLFREGLYGRETATPRWYLHGVFA
jgi:protein ImuB